MFSFINIFRIVALLEGISYLVLMFGSVLKRVADNDSIVKLLGMPHGLLFVAYIALAFMIRKDFNWTNKQFAIVLIASVIPFGTFYIDRTYLKVNK